MPEFIKRIDTFLEEIPDNFWNFYNWFQNSYFGERNIKFRAQLQNDELVMLSELNDLLAYAGTDPTSEERDNGIVDQYEFQQRLKELKLSNSHIWKRYGF